MLILKTMDPDGERLVVFTNKVGVVPICWYIWIVITISYHKSFPFLVLKMGSPRIYCGAKTFNSKKSQVCGMTVLRLQAHKANQENPKDDKKRGWHRKHACERHSRILLRYQHDDKVAGSRSFSLCKSAKRSIVELCNAHFRRQIW